MRASTIRTLITGLAVCLGTNAMAEDGPSYDETVEFILSKVNLRLDDGGKDYSLIHVYEKSRCTFAYHRTSYWLSDLNGRKFSSAKKVVTLKNVVDFSAIDPSRNRVYISDNGDGSVEITTKEEQRQIAINLFFGPESPTYEERKNDPDLTCVAGGECTSQVDFGFNMRFHTFNAKVNGPKLSRALAHLTRICAGTEELF